MLSWWLGMIIYTVLITICITVLISKLTYYYFDIGEKIGIGVLVAFCLLIISGIGLLYSECNTTSNYKEIIENNKQYIYSLEDNINMSGAYTQTFIIGSGSIGENLYYYTLIGNESGYILQKFNAEEVYLVPEEDVKPYYIEKYQVVDKHYNKNFIFGIMFKNFKSVNGLQLLIKKELHLPKNYIKQNYNVDLK